ncbi:MAG: release factor glutamine methyltransferase [Candidatus Binatia bacterium]|nr:MAG: release factor glutamine methyltransferase [Candidatus Binatia bacterium]
MRAADLEAGSLQASVLTLRNWLAAATALLDNVGVRDARIAAEWLAMAALGMDRAGLYARLGETLSVEAAARLSVWLDRCRAREPVAYIVGEREFWSRAFTITPAVLVPRPETEHVVEAAVDCFPEGRTGEAVRVCDVGTGSGCIAVSLACEWPRAFVLATDVSLPALRVARRNAQRHGVVDRMYFVCSHALDGLSPASLDLVVANPPYLTTEEWNRAEPELRWEPRLALDGGADGLDVVRAIVEGARRALRPGGWLILEVGATQAQRVEALLREAGMERGFVRHDLAGWPRVIAARN